MHFIISPSSFHLAGARPHLKNEAWLLTFDFYLDQASDPRFTFHVLHPQDRDRRLRGGGHLQYHLQSDHHVPPEYPDGAAQRPLHLLHQLPHSAHLLVRTQCRSGGGGEG